MSASHPVSRGQDYGYPLCSHTKLGFGVTMWVRRAVLRRRGIDRDEHVVAERRESKCLESRKRLPLPAHELLVLLAHVLYELHSIGSDVLLDEVLVDDGAGAADRQIVAPSLSSGWWPTSVNRSSTNASSMTVCQYSTPLMPRSERKAGDTYIDHPPFCSAVPVCTLSRMHVLTVLLHAIRLCKSNSACVPVIANGLHNLDPCSGELMHAIAFDITAHCAQTWR